MLDVKLGAWLLSVRWTWVQINKFITITDYYGSVEEREREEGKWNCSKISRSDPRHDKCLWCVANKGQYKRNPKEICINPVQSTIRTEYKWVEKRFLPEIKWECKGWFQWRRGVKTNFNYNLVTSFLLLLIHIQWLIIFIHFYCRCVFFFHFTRLTTCTRDIYSGP